MKVIRNLKKIYKNMSWYNRQKLMDANCKKSKKKPRQKLSKGIILKTENHARVSVSRE